MGVDLRHHIGQQLGLPALEDDDGRDAVHGAPDFRQAQQARFAVLVQLRSLIRRRAGLADGIGQLGEQLGALTLQGIVKKTSWYSVRCWVSWSFILLFQFPGVWWS